MKYKVGDKIRLKGTDSAGTVIDIIIRNQLLILLSDGSKIVEWPENVVLIEGLAEEKTKPEPKFKVGDSVESEEEIEFTEEDKYWCDIMSESDPTTYVLPQGYQFKDENGNVINAMKIVLEKKKKEYPKTYEECLKVLAYDDRETYCIFHTGADERLFEALYRLKVCRDAYWKIAGEEMGLGKPWEPDWKDGDTHKFNIHVIKDEIRCGVGLVKSDLLSFPTEEMRDAFYENFKELIEQCKELL